MTKGEYTTHLRVRYTSPHNLVGAIFEEIRVIEEKNSSHPSKNFSCLEDSNVQGLSHGKVICNIRIVEAIQKSKNVAYWYTGRQIFHHKLGQMVRYHILYSFLVLDNDIEFLE